MILITGVAGFLGSHLAARLLDLGLDVFGVDNINDYYSPVLKRHRLNILIEKGLKFELVDIASFDDLSSVFLGKKIDVVVNLAAQAGVRYSIENPICYTTSNLVGFSNVLEVSRLNAVSHLIYASSSSVYGERESAHFSELDDVSSPLSYYAATKRANELMAYSYNSIYGLSVTGLRFFSVYGEWGRPDMAYYKFANNIVRGLPIDVYEGDIWRDFTYIDDVVESIYRIYIGGALGSSRLFNVGFGAPVKLIDMVDFLQGHLNKRAIIRRLPKPNSDVLYTSANVEALRDAIGYQPKVNLNEGLKRFVDWYHKHDGLSLSLT